MMDALWTTLVGILSDRARRTISVCVVALDRLEVKSLYTAKTQGMGIPKWISYYE